MDDFFCFQSPRSFVLIMNDKAWDRVKRSGLLFEAIDNPNRGTVIYKNQTVCRAIRSEYLPLDENTMFLIKEV